MMRRPLFVTIWSLCLVCPCAAQEQGDASDANVWSMHWGYDEDKPCASSASAVAR